jgi:2-dehydropantoate 2-reductase
VLCIRAIREGFKVLRALGEPIEPPYFKVFEWLPEPLLVFLLGRALDTEYAAIGVAGHANVARDEFQELANDFRELIRATTVPTPAIDHLSRYVDSAYPIAPDGSSELSMDWGSVCIGLGALAGVLFVSWLRRSERR